MSYIAFFFQQNNKESDRYLGQACTSLHQDVGPKS